jgi:hypothetical protein
VALVAPELKSAGKIIRIQHQNSEWRYKLNFHLKFAIIGQKACGGISAFLSDL